MLTHLANGALGEPKGYPGPVPLGGEHGLEAVEVEHVAAVEQHGGDRGERVGEADHAHVVIVLPQPRALVAPLQTRQTHRLARDTPARVAAGVGLGAGGGKVTLAEEIFKKSNKRNLLYIPGTPRGCRPRRARA